MKHLFTLVTLFTITVQGVLAQQPGIRQHIKKQRSFVPKQPNAARPASNTAGAQCGFASVINQAKANGFSNEAFESTLKTMIQRKLESGSASFTGTVTIPVVFHCIYRNGQTLSTTSPNLTAAMYQAQINQLNADYANLSGSVYGVAADVRIQFCLAVVDTAGKPMAEPGIDRINGSIRGWPNTNTMGQGAVMGLFNSTIKPQSIWDPFSYFNIWTAGLNSSGLLGYATFPSFSTLDGLDDTESSATAGCVINWQTIGSINLPGQDMNFGLGRTLSHETGHFLGLRHIWGDDACGNDYCADTPPQDDASNGCPTTGALNGCTPSAAKMFENYMDYTNDACVNTFTAHQALRMETVMDNSPRRFSLMASKACQARPGNAIAFSTATPYVVAEKGNAGTCPNARSYSFNIHVSEMASGAATVSFIATGSTATLNEDFEISPATITWAANDATPKTITITVLDDQAVEATEQIQLSYTIAGTGVVAAPDKQMLTLYITDDDVSGIAVNELDATPLLLSQNFNASANIPAGWATEAYGDGVSLPNQWVVSANGGIGTTGNAAHITRSTTTKVNQYNNLNFTDAYLYSPLINATGASDITLSFKWRCLGEVEYDEGYIGYIPEGMAVTAENVIYLDTSFVGLAAATTAQTATLNLPLSLTNTRFYLVFNWFNDNSEGSNPPFTLDDITVTGNRFSIATTVGADTTLPQYTAQSVSYYSKSSVGNKIIATIANPSLQLGCVSAAVQNDGTGKTLLATSTGSYFRTNKVISISPTAPNSNVTYQATLYFTASELSPTWTPSEIANMRMLKVRDAVDLFSTIDAADVQVVTPTFEDHSAEGYYSYTGNFTGFSQFMLAIPNTVVPVSLLNFSATANKSAILLSWNTATEINNKGFTIERSEDGIQFTSIGWVNSKGSNTLQNNYTFPDNFVQPGIVYYYRLRQVDTDGRQTLSPIRKAAINTKGVTVTVSPVPVKNTMNVFIKGGTMPANLHLLNAQGQLVKSWKNVNAGNSTLQLDVANLPAGIYMLHVELAAGKVMKKVMIER